jgi:cyclic pyranopterin phosphate synthase
LLERLLITTNGLLLAPLLPALVAAGLDAVNVSIDTLRPERFEALTLRPGLPVALAAVDAAVAAGLRVKVNAVALRGVNEDELADLARRFAGERGLEMRYLEYMPFDGNHWSDSAMLPAAGIREILARDFELEPDPQAAGDGGGTATLHRLRERGKAGGAGGAPGGGWLPGRVGVIATITEPFCGDCSRLRLTAEGHLRWCLLDEGEVDLRGPLRAGASDGELAGLIEGALGRKAAGHAEARVLVQLQASGPARAMVRIGG